MPEGLRERYNGHSMVGELQRVLVCSPRTAGWDDPAAVGRWRDLGFLRPPDFHRAQAQHDALCRMLVATGAEVLHMLSSPNLTLDAVYAHDAALPTDFGLIAMHAGKENRLAESRQQREFCESIGISTLGAIQASGKTEAGDMVWLDSVTLLIGNGYRTNLSGISQMRDLLQPHGVEVLTAPLPYGQGPSACLHLMSLISLLDQKTALVDLPWLAVGTIELLKSRSYSFVEIDPSERETLACNVLALGNRRLVALEENHKTNQRLRDAGFEVHTFPGSEICINGSGGPTCLTRPLLRGNS
jgi:N-dimethylarginine dimethylaminohydrolase